MSVARLVWFARLCVQTVLLALHFNCGAAYSNCTHTHSHGLSGGVNRCFGVHLLGGRNWQMLLVVCVDNLLFVSIVY